MLASHVLLKNELVAIFTKATVLRCSDVIHTFVRVVGKIEHMLRNIL